MPIGKKIVSSSYGAKYIKAHSTKYKKIQKNIVKRNFIVSSGGLYANQKRRPK
jgi:hypothetical protein